MLSEVEGFLINVEGLRQAQPDIEKQCLEQIIKK
jgi:hypothetical protein